MSVRAAATKLGTSAAGAFGYTVSELTAETEYSYTLSISNNATTVKLGEVGVYSEIEPPTITAMKIEGAAIRLEVKGMSEAADYFVVSGCTPGASAPGRARICCLLSCGSFRAA